MIRIALASLLLLVSLPLAAQEVPQAPQAAMANIAFLLGDWEGEGWIARGPDKHEFKQSEQVRALLNGDAILIEGQGRLADGTLIHDAAAIIGYDADARAYRMQTFLRGGRGANAQFSFDDGVIEWTPSPGKVRYLIEVDEEGLWQERGEYSQDGGQNWQQFLSMTLERVDG